MPNIVTNFAFLENSENAFVSMLSDKTPTAFYSSITIPRAKDATKCLTCAVLNLSQQELNDFITGLVDLTSLEKFRSPFFDSGGATFAVTLPVIPPLAEV